MNEPRAQRGQVLVIFALFLIVLLGATALAVDYGSWLKVRRDYQNVTDAAALAGGPFLLRPITNANRTLAREAAWTSLQTQLGLTGLTGSQSINQLRNDNTPAGTPVVSDGYRLWVSTPPIDAGGKYPGKFTTSSSRTLFVWVERENPSFFSRILGIGDKSISAWATSGMFPNRFAVITLREQGQDPVSVGEDIKLAGNTTVLEVIDGDVGGNWNMKLNSGAQLWIHGQGNNDAEVYLIDYIPCGPSCWSTAPNQVNSGPNGSPPNVDKPPQELPGPIEDPDYQLHSSIASLPATGGTSAVAPGDGYAAGKWTNGNTRLTISNGTKSANGVGCTADSPRLGPGWYRDLRVTGCVVLDPTHTYSDPDNADPALRGQADLPSTRQPGIYYITGAMNVTSGALVVGDGVTIVFYPSSSNNDGLVVPAGGIVDLNTGASDGVLGFPPNNRKGAFLTDGTATYGFDSGTATWQYNTSLNSDQRVGVAVYVAKPAQIGNNGAEANTALLKVNAGAGLAWTGVTYAPRDNVTISGQPSHDGIGQLISWTVTFAGGDKITQIFDGPDESTPRLLEPTLGQ